jgi:branched-chain amino acid transport system substrate-binding protein
MCPLEVQFADIAESQPELLARRLREGLGDKADQLIVASQSYETTDPTVDPQILSLQGSGANVLLTAAVPKFAAQAIRKVFEIGWKPTHFW